MNTLITKESYVALIKADVKMQIFESFCKRLTNDKALIESITAGVTLIEGPVNFMKMPGGGKDEYAKYKDPKYAAQQVSRLRELTNERLSSDGDTSESYDKLEEFTNMRDGYLEKLQEIEDKLLLNTKMPSPGNKDALNEKKEKIEGALEKLEAAISKLEQSKKAGDDKPITGEESTLRDELARAAYQTIFNHANKASRQGNTGEGNPDIVGAIGGELYALLNSTRFINTLADKFTGDKGSFHTYLSKIMENRAPKLAKKAREQLINVTSLPQGATPYWKPYTEILNVGVKRWNEMKKAAVDPETGKRIPGDKGEFNNMDMPLPHQVKHRQNIYTLSPGVDGIDAEDNIESPEQNSDWTLHAAEGTATALDAPVGGGGVDVAVKSLGDTIGDSRAIGADEKLILNTADIFVANLKDIDFVKDIVVQSGRSASMDPLLAQKYYLMFDRQDLFNLFSGKRADIIPDSTVLDVFGDSALDENGNIKRAKKDTLSGLRQGITRKFMKMVNLGQIKELSELEANAEDVAI